ncbi:MAG: ABC transporter permease [Fimbriimonadaceae bacterium]
MHPIIHIYLKELRDMFRDKRVRANALFMPAMIIIMTFTLLGFVIEAVNKPSNQTIHVVNGDSSFAKALEKGDVKIVKVDSVEEGKKLIEAGKATVVLDFPMQPPNRVPQVKIQAYFDPKEEKAKVSLGLLQKLYGEVSKKSLKEMLASKGLPQEASDPIVVVEHEVVVGKKESAGAFLISMLPYLIIIWAFFGGMSIVSDLVAGEKEKLTLETLLISPVKRSQIAIGKFLALSTISMSSCTSAILGVFIMSKLKMGATSKLMEGGLGFGLPELLAVIGTLIPLVCFLAALMIAISAYAKNMREAQSHLGLASFVVMMPMMMTQFIGYSDFAKSMAINAIPILNSASIIRAALQGKTELVPVLISILANGLLAAIMLTLATRMFQREKILVRS